MHTLTQNIKCDIAIASSIYDEWKIGLTFDKLNLF